MTTVTQISESKKVIGFTDSVNECDCCGKSGLKGTFCVSIDGQEFYYGSTCAFKKHGFDKKEVENSVKLYNNKLDSFSRLAGKQLRKELGFNNVSETQYNERLKYLMSI